MGLSLVFPVSDIDADLLQLESQSFGYLHHAEKEVNSSALKLKVLLVPTTLFKKTLRLFSSSQVKSYLLLSVKTHLIRAV